MACSIQLFYLNRDLTLVMRPDPGDANFDLFNNAILHALIYNTVDKFTQGQSK